ncbi:MAG TPA: hypothetical protein VD767_06865, partial [Thermomicrobiales bacterium]|nr:hypothetical protein [Thermomicrobiales bacterium]
MIQSTVSSIAPETGLRSAPTFRAWQRSTVEHGLLPVVAVAGGRGKSTVARMVDAIVNAALLRSATWTNLGVELRGRRQRGEIGGWAVALSRLAESSLDIALQEMHWSTINAVGLPHASYPVIALTNLNGVSEHQPPSNGDAESLRGALRAASAAHHLGTVVASADDSGLYDAARTTQAQLVVTALARESPVLRAHLQAGGQAVWIENDYVRGGSSTNSLSFCHVNDLECALNGSVQFEVANALTAIAIASAVGIDHKTISE